MTPTSLSRWADQNNVPRRTAYNWAKSGRLPVPVHRTRTGRLVVLDDSDVSQDAPAFVVAYAEALGSRAGGHVGDRRYSPVLEAWGVDLYDAVSDDLRPLVLRLALEAACGRSKIDVWWRLADWLGRVELTDWYIATGFPEVAALLRYRGEITDEDSFNASWPTGIPAFEFSGEFYSAAEAAVEAAGLAIRLDDDSAADELAEFGLIGLDDFALAPRRAEFRRRLSDLAGFTTANGDRIPELPNAGDLWDLSHLYLPPMYALARPYTRRTATEVCAIIGVDPAGPPPAPGHFVREIGMPVCTHTASSALQPQLHDAHIREIRAFRRIALGQPTTNTTT